MVPFMPWVQISHSLMIVCLLSDLSGLLVLIHLKRSKQVGRCIVSWVGRGHWFVREAVVNSKRTLD